MPHSIRLYIECAVSSAYVVHVLCGYECVGPHRTRLVSELVLNVVPRLKFKFRAAVGALAIPYSEEGCAKER